MANVFDQFDQPAQPAGSAFDQFDEAPKGAKATATDYLKGFAAGSNQLASGVGYLLEKAGAADTGKSLREVGQEGEKYWKDSMTPAGRRAATNQVFEDDPNSILPRLGDTPVQSALMGAAESAPSTVAMAIPGGMAAGALTRGAAGLAARGIGGATTAIAGGLASPVGVGSKIIAASPSAIGMGAAEGITSGAMNAAQTKAEIEQAPEEKLIQSPKYQELRRTMGANDARAALAEMAGADVFARTAASTGVLGVLTGGGALGGAYRTATKGTRDGAVKGIAKEIGNEAFQETVQSGPEQYIQNVAKRDYLDPNQNVMEGVVSGALSGGVTGGLMGGVMGGAGHIAGRRQADGMGQPLPSPPDGGPATSAQTGTSPSSPVPPAANNNQSALDTVAQAVAAEEAAAAAENQSTADQPSPVPAAQLATPNAPAAPGTLSAPGSTAAPTVQTNQAESAGAPIPQPDSVDPQRDERAKFYENMASEREARGDQYGLRKAAEYRQTAANIRAGGAASPTRKGAATGGIETEKGIKEKKGRTKKSAEVSSTGVTAGADSATNTAGIESVNSSQSHESQGTVAKAVQSATLPAVPDTTSEPPRKTAVELPNIRGTSEEAGPEVSETHADAKHVEGNTSETATQAVIKESVSKGAKKAGLDLRQEHANLLKQIDSAIAKAGEDGAESSVTFDVPGDGKFKVTNTKERLQWFRGKIVASERAFKPVPNPAAHKTPMERVQGGTASDSTVRNMLIDGDLTAALELSKVIGRPLVFGANADGGTPIVFTDAKPVSFPGFEKFAMASGRSFMKGQKASSAWTVTDMATGLSIASGITRDAAEQAAKERLANMDGKGFQDLVDLHKANGKAVSQSDLEAAWVKWAEEEEKAVDNASAIQAKADREREDREKRNAGAWEGFTGKSAEGFLPFNPNQMTPEGVAAGYMQASKNGKGNAFLDYATSVLDSDVLPQRKVLDRIKMIRDSSVGKWRYVGNVAPGQLPRSEFKATTKDGREIVANLDGDTSVDGFVREDGIIKDKIGHGSAGSLTLEQARALADEAIARLMNERPVKPETQPSTGSQLAHAEPQPNTEDAGAELTYNRRNRMTRGLKWEDIADKDEALRVREATKAKVYPKPDYKAMIDGGMRPQLAHIVKQVYDSIATVPQTGRRAAPSDEDIRNYIAGVNRVMDAVTEWAGDKGRGGAWLASTARRNLPKFRGAIDLSSFADDREDQRALLSSAFPDGYEPVRQELIAIGGNKVYAALQPSGRELNVAVKAVKDGWPESQEAWQRQGFSIIHGDGVKADASPSRHNIGVNVRFEIPNGTFSRTLKTIFVEGSRDTESPEVRSAIDQGIAEFSGRFVLLNKAKSVVSLHATEEAAKEAARSQVSRAGRKATVSDKGISVLASERIGADRRMPGEDISSDRLRDTFRFKGVNFGNWMKGDANTHERQLHLNHAYDSFMDLAEVLGVPPEAMSLNGILGVAIGAQGSGGFAAAHFVPGVNEINLTREYGAGSLAHEWGHALDHYFARQAGLTRATDPFLTEHLKAAAGSEIRPEILDKFKAIVQAMRKRPMTPAEAAARREEQLASAKRNLDGWLRSVLPGTTQEDEEIAKAVARIQSGDLGDGDIAISRTVAVKPAIADLAKLIKEKTGRNLGKTELAGIGASARNLQYQQSRTEDEAAHVPQQMVTTQYERDAQKLDAEKGGRKYWSTPLEMFARAFDAFVSDTLEAKAAKNTYLSHAGRSGETVPSGSERTAINEAIKGLADAIETKAGDDGNVILFSQSGALNISPADSAVYEMAAEGKSAADILSFISKASRRPFNRYLASALARIGVSSQVTLDSMGGWKFNQSKQGAKYAAAYNPKTDTVALFTPRSAEHHALHEFVHAATLKAIAKGGPAALQMRELFRHVLKSGDLADMYGMSNIDEFVSEAFTNPKFQSALKAVPAPGSSKLKSAWEWFVRLVARALGLKTAAQETALDRAMTVGAELMRENAALNDAAGGVRYAQGAHLLAPNGNPSNLNERQWHEVRTPEFKAWFGDWELASQKLRSASTFAEARASSKDFQGKDLTSADGITATVSRNSIDKMLSSSAVHKSESTSEHALAVANMDKLFAQAVTGWTKTDRAGSTEIDAVRRMFAPMLVDGGARLVKITVKEFALHGNRVYSVESISVGEVSPVPEMVDADRANGSRLLTGPTGLVDSLVERIRNFNPGAVSKVVDENGEPMVVYHGTKSEVPIAEFRRGKDGIWFAENSMVSDQRGESSDYYLQSKNHIDMTDESNSSIVDEIEREAFDDGELLDEDGRPESLFELVKFGNLISNGRAAQSRVIEAIKRRGYSGLKWADFHQDALDIVHVVFAPTQIKSAIGNSGQFSPDNPDIRYNLASTATSAPGAPTPPAAPRNVWQKAKAKAAALLTPGRLDKLIYEFQDKYVDLKRLRDHIKAIGGTITDLNDAYLGEELYHKRLAYRTEQFEKDEILPLMAEMRAKGVKQEELETFLHARHAPEANAEMARRNPNQAEIDAVRQQAAATVRGLELQLQRARATGTATKAIEEALNEARGELANWNGAQAFTGTEDERLSLSGMSDAAAASIMSGLSPQRRAALDALAKRVDAINAGTLQLLDDYGLMSKASLNEWRKKYQHYIPLHRDEAHPDSLSHPIGQGFSTKGDAAKRRTGSNQKVTHILGHIAMQREAALTRGEKNHVMLKLYLMARQNPLPDVWKVGSVPMIDTIDKATGFVKSVPDPLYKNRPNVIMLRIAGKDVAITMNEHNQEALRMAHAMKNLDVDDLHYLIPVVGKMTRYFASINTQYNPIFGIINLMRDTQEAALNLSTTELAGKQKEILKDTLSILKDVLKNKGRMPKAGQWATLFADFNEVGGTTGYRDLYLDAEDRGKALLRTLQSLERGKASQAAHAVAEWLSDYNEAMENATRLAAYKAAIDNGMSKERAASLAKNLTVNFNRKGRQTRELGALYAFFNAAVQGTARMAQTLAGPSGRKIMAGGVLLGALNAMMGIALMGGGDDGDDEWEKIPEFIKQRSIIIPVGKQDYLSIPMPLGFQFLPNIGRLAVEMAVYKDKTAGKQMVGLFSVLAEAFNPLGGNAPFMQVIAPTVMDPLVALAQNKDWTGKPIYNENRNSLDRQPGFKLSKDSATPWAKAFSEAINAITGGTSYAPGGWSPTPDQIDYVIGQLTGGIGREAGKVASTVAAPFTGEELPPYKIPLVGRLYGSTSGHSGQSEKFYENITLANEAENEIKGRAKDGFNVAEYLLEHPGAIELAARGNVAERQVSKLRAMRHSATREGGSDSVAKVRAINEQMSVVMRSYNNDVDKMNRRVGQ